MFKCIERDSCNKTKIETTCMTSTSCYTANKKTVKKSKAIFCKSSGCFDEQLVQLYCKNSFNEIINYNESTITCCNHGDYCNGLPDSMDPSHYVFYTLVTSILIGIIYLIYKKRKFKVKFKKRPQPDELSIVIEKSFYKQIIFIENIGVGRFGKVFKGLYYDQLVAVKVFTSNDYDSYKRELDIYKLHSLSRDSILKCIGWDTALVDFSTEYWLVLDYCKLGSLYDYLQNHQLTTDQLLSIMLSAISGLNHLHDTQEFTVSKPGISHRDIKSKNLLMKTDRTVCIADFGLSLTKNEIDSKENIKIQVGTRRYWSPELLDDSLNRLSFKSFCLSDIYSYSLVFWESLNRSVLNPNASNYLLPYYEYTGNDPSINDMIEVVINKKLRPRLLDEDEKKRPIEVDPICQSICSLIRECWDQNPTKRWNSLKIKEMLNSLFY